MKGKTVSKYKYTMKTFEFEKKGKNKDQNKSGKNKLYLNQHR